MTRSILIALVIAVVAAGWILSGQLGPDDAASVENESAPQGTETPEQPLPDVRVMRITAEQHRTELRLFGQTEADRSVEIKAETSGRIREVLIEEGSTVEAGTIFARIDLEDRAARLRSAESLVRQRELEFQASSKLSEKSFRSQTQLAESEANLETAKAELAEIREDLANTNLRTPFDGLLQARPIEVGDFVTSGDVVGHVVDLSPMVVSIQVSENRISRIALGAQATARFIDGRKFPGIVKFISAVSDAATRTFEVEIELANEDLSIPAGMTSQIFLPMETSMAHLISPSILTLDDDGVIGVKAVDELDRVVFHPVDMLEDTPQGVWVQGLPDTVTAITVGQEFVTPGQQVRPSEESNAGPDGKIVAMEGPRP